MLENTLKKTLYERRWGLLWWSLGILISTVLIVLLFPVFQDSFGKSLQDVPDSLKQILGEAADYQRIEGFLELQVYMQMIFFTVIYGIVLCTSLIAGEESGGTLQSLLVQPITRSKVYVQKAAAAAILIAGVCASIFIGTWIGALMINEPINIWRNLQATFAMWLVTFAFSIIAFVIGAATGRRGMSGAFAGVFAFVAYMISSLVQTAEVLKYPNYLSPFKYFNNPRILDNGLQASNVIILVAATSILLVIGWLVFRKRDVYQR